MSSQAGISVLVLTYQHSAYIAQCLEGILAQEWDGPLQVVVADDASTDDTAQTAQAIAAANPCVELEVNATNLGAAGNFEKALRRCTHPLIAFCEGDDFWIWPGKLRAQAAQLNEYPEATLVYTDYCKVDTDGVVLQERVLEPQPERFGIADLAVGHGPSTNTVMLRRSIFPKRFPKAFFEVPNPDVFIFGWALSKGHGRYIDQVGSAYRLHPGGVWSSLHPVEKRLVRLTTHLAVLEHLGAAATGDYAARLKAELSTAMEKLARTGDPLYAKYAGHLSRLNRWILRYKIGKQKLRNLLP